MSSATFNVTGMHCSSCSMLITMNLEDLAGVVSVDCNHATGKTVVEYDGSKTSVDAIANEILAAGYTAAIAD